MNRALWLALVLLFAVNCAKHTARQVDVTANANQSSWSGSWTTAPTNGESAKETQREMETPAEFREVDFKNFSYPDSYGDKDIRLKDGEYELADREVAGGYTVNFQGVDFVDLTGDGRTEAVVRLFGVLCGGSCDGGSHLIYIYTKPRRTLRLLWHIQTGSLAYGCGLKSLTVKKRFITLEGFGDCRLARGELTAANELGKFEVEEFTKFDFEFADGKLAFKKRESFPSPLRDVRGYEPNINISDD